MPYWAVEYFDQNLHQVVLGIFKPESASIFSTSPVYILCNYRKSQISYCDILHEVENSSIVQTLCLIIAFTVCVYSNVSDVIMSVGPP